MSIDWTKPILWGGKPARVLATDLKGPFSYAVAVDRGDMQGEVIVKTNASGFCSSTYSTPLICMITNAPERVERWANVGGPDTYLHCLVWHKTKTLADCSKGSGCTSQLYGTFEGDKLVDVAIVPLEPAS